MKKEYTEQSVIRDLNKLSEISINTINKTIYVLNNPTNIGIKAWGKIEYLKKVHGYVQLFTDTLSKNNKQYKPKEDESVEVKRSKRDKVNISNKVKNVMSKTKLK